MAVFIFGSFKCPDWQFQVSRNTYTRVWWGPAPTPPELFWPNEGAGRCWMCYDLADEATDFWDKILKAVDQAFGVQIAHVIVAGAECHKN